MEGEATSFIGRQAWPEEPDETDGHTAPTFPMRMYSGSDDQPAPAGAGHPSHVQEDETDEEWRRKGRPNYLNYGRPLQLSHGSSIIFRVPKNLRDCDPKAYEPTVVTIGLFHFGKGPELSPQLHKYKSDCVSHLLARQGNEKARELLEECLKLVLTLEPCARMCYSVDVEYVDRHKFAEMLLQDGCFILCLLLMCEECKSPKVAPYSTIDSSWIYNMVVYDLVKLENQIPFFVVQRLFDLLKTPAENNINLVERALQFFSRVDPERAHTFETPSSSAVLHLLHLFHSSLIPPKLEKMTLTESPPWIPSATVLQDAGVKFRPPNKRRPESFLDVIFENGVMEIPPLEVFDNTSQIFRNLIAFEQLHMGINRRISAYADFMDDLINTARDVRLLSLDGVLLNRLGTEEAAADVFNKLCDQTFYANNDYLCKVFTDVTNYYESLWPKWRAALFRNYFSNPWAIISVLAAVVLLLLSIEQAVFAGLSYFRSPS